MSVVGFPSGNGLSLAKLSADEVDRLNDEAIAETAEILSADEKIDAEAVVANLAALSPLQYDQVRADQAKYLGVRPATLDAEVKQARNQRADESQSGFMSDPEPWPDPVNGAALLNRISEAASRHLVLPDGAAEIVALWTVFSHCYDCFDISPILAATSPTPECGKTTLLTLLGALVWKPLASSNLTSSTIFRAIDKWSPTLIIDEADTFLKDSDELRGILNSGHNRRNAFVLRTEGESIGWRRRSRIFLQLLRPTIRTEGSEIWFSWNPRRKADAVDILLRSKAPPSALVVNANWEDNPWFSAELESERQLDLTEYPERYSHIWEGDYAKAFEGAYFAKGLALAREQGRIGNVAADPLLQLKAFWDIGGAGAKADACAIWIVQWVGKEIRALDYIEGQGQVLGYYTNLLRERGYDRIQCYLPHDGVNTSAITGLKYQDHLSDAGFPVEVIKNQGMGAAAMRIEAVRRLLPKCWFNEATTEGGRDALGYYHERKDDHRDIGLGPEHDWSSHAADSFGLMAISYEEPSKLAGFHRPIVYPRIKVA